MRTTSFLARAGLVGAALNTALDRHPTGKSHRRYMSQQMTQTARKVLKKGLWKVIFLPKHLLDLLNVLHQRKSMQVLFY